MKKIETKIIHCIHVGLAMLGVYTLLCEWLIHILDDTHPGCIFNALFAF